MPTSIAPCSKCGHVHAPGELFVPTAVTGRHMLEYEDTCELESARQQAHAALQPAGAVAYHATDHVVAVLNYGLDPAASGTFCKHVCLASTPEIAAGVDLGALVLEVDISGLDLFFEMGEARHHGAPIEPDRLRVLGPQPAPVKTGWSDPGWRRNHSDCLDLRGLPLSRRILRAARDEADRRHGYEHTFEQYRAVAVELAAETG